MDVNRARAFVAVAEELHFGRAAARLHIAQPPLSRTIQALEKELGAELFERSPRRVRLTAVGEALLEPARQLIMQSERIVHLVHRVQQGEIGRIRLGFSGASMNSIVGTLVRKVQQNRPDLTIELSAAHLSHPGLARLRSGALDAIVGRWDFLPRDVDSLALATEELVVALPENHWLTPADAVTSRDVADEPWIVLPGGSSATLSTRLHTLAQRGRFIPRIVETAMDSATQLLMVEAGIGIALTFSRVRENIPVHAVAFRPLIPDLGAVDVRLAWRKSDVSPALAALIAITKTLPTRS